MSADLLTETVDVAVEPIGVNLLIVFVPEAALIAQLDAACLMSAAP